MQDAQMPMRLGDAVYQEDDFRVVQVVEPLAGFTVVGPGFQPLFLHPEVAGAVSELKRILKKA